MSKKIFLIACEPSGDTHTAALVRAMKRRNSALRLIGLGGPKMEQAGVRLLEDMTKISAVGLGDVIRQYFRYRAIFYRALHEIKKETPDAVILVDSPAFNLRIAKKIRRMHPRLPILYYISPQLWAWGARRIHTVKKTVSKMFVILPFEVPLYEKAGVACEFVGHPLLDHLNTSHDREALRSQLRIQDGQVAIGLMPGSRKKEVERILPLMVRAAEHLKREIPGAVFLMARSGNVKYEIYDAILKNSKIEVLAFDNHLHDHIASMDFALVASGTATLETALMKTPFFLLYKTGWLTYWLGRFLIRVPFLGLVNLLAGKRVVPEFIQGDAHPETIAHEARVLLQTPELYEKMKWQMGEVKDLLGEQGASERAAHSMLDFLAQEEKKV